jgi:hypothetical protein
MSYAGAPEPMLAALLTIVVLVFAKAVAANQDSERQARLSAALNVGIVPLGLQSVVLAVAGVARVLNSF